jgi:hypothetical protein
VDGIVEVSQPMITTKNITKHPDYNCHEYSMADHRGYHLIGGGRDGKTEPTRIALPFTVELQPSQGLAAWLNRNCEG